MKLHLIAQVGIFLEETRQEWPSLGKLNPATSSAHGGGSLSRLKSRPKSRHRRGQWRDHQPGNVYARGKTQVRGALEPRTIP